MCCRVKVKRYYNKLNLGYEYCIRGFLFEINGVMFKQLQKRKRILIIKIYDIKRAYLFFAFYLNKLHFEFDLQKEKNIV